MQIKNVHICILLFAMHASAAFKNAFFFVTIN